MGAEVKKDFGRSLYIDKNWEYIESYGFGDYMIDFSDLTDDRLVKLVEFMKTEVISKPPIPKDIKFCPSCGEANIKVALNCYKCGWVYEAKRDG